MKSNSSNLCIIYHSHFLIQIIEIGCRNALRNQFSHFMSLAIIGSIIAFSPTSKTQCLSQISPPSLSLNFAFNLLLSITSLGFQTDCFSAGMSRKRENRSRKGNTTPSHRIVIVTRVSGRENLYRQARIPHRALTDSGPPLNCQDGGWQWNRSSTDVDSSAHNGQASKGCVLVGLWRKMRRRAVEIGRKAKAYVAPGTGRSN